MLIEPFSVGEANQLAPAHARVEKALLLATAPYRPLVSVGRDTIQRVASLAQYMTEIDRLYSNAEVGLDDDVDAMSSNPTDSNAVNTLVRGCTLAATGWSDKDDSTSFIDRGMDSLQALQLKGGLYRPDIVLLMYIRPYSLQLISVAVARRKRPTTAHIRCTAAGSAPETVLESLDTPSANGYSRSKFLSELLCDSAVQHLGVPVVIARVGQVAGPQVSDADLVPSDLLAETVVDLACPSDPRTTEGSGAGVCNMRSLNMATWDALLPAITNAIRARLSRAPDVVPPSSWLDGLKESKAAAVDNASRNLTAVLTFNPAIKLLDLYP
ncbi:hypothetical protein DL765_005108 [Monosporascus sp. GIB2]|nr:hypothetical protein DL765_005108 [Monosporascus sp. GIB2]